MRIFVLGIIIVLGFVPADSQTRWDDTREIVLDTYEQPMPFKMGEDLCIAYELHITNFGLDSLFIEGIQVFTDDSVKPLKTYSGESLKKCLSRIRVPTSKSDDPFILMGQRAILHAMLCIPPNRAPKKIWHQVEYHFIHAGKNEKTILTKGGTLMVNGKDRALVIGAPLGEGNWKNGNAVEDGYAGHRRGAIRPLNGIPFQKQRYAMDFMRVNEKGEAYQGQMTDNRNWFGYDSDVLAVADGRVVEILDDAPECQPFFPDEERLLKITNLSGNYIVLNLENHLYAFYGHLKPGSLLIKKGDLVKKGQPMAKLGNSGNSTAPHLHFAINRNVPIRGEAIPFVFESYEYLGSAPNDAPIGSIFKRIEDDIVSQVAGSMEDRGMQASTREKIRQIIKNSMPEVSESKSGSKIDFFKNGEFKTEMMPEANSVIRFVKK